MPLMKKGRRSSTRTGSTSWRRAQIRDDITVIMVAPKAPGTEVREEYKRGFGVPTLVAVHEENDPAGDGFEIAKAYAAGTGGDRAGVLGSRASSRRSSRTSWASRRSSAGCCRPGRSSASTRWSNEGVEPGYASRLVQYGWETITEALKLGGMTNMMDRLPNPAKIAATALADELKAIMEPLYVEHMDDILSAAKFSRTMMEDWKKDDADLLRWREETGQDRLREDTRRRPRDPEQEYFTNGVLMVAMVKAGVELAFETMVRSGIKEESAYYESHHEVPLIANLIARKKLYEMNRVISDTAEYGTYLFANRCVPLLSDFMKKIDASVIGKPYPGVEVDNRELIEVNGAIESHPIEIVGARLRKAMRGMKSLK